VLGNLRVSPGKAQKDCCLNWVTLGNIVMKEVHLRVDSPWWEIPIAFLALGYAYSNIGWNCSPTLLSNWVAKEDLAVSQTRSLMGVPVLRRSVVIVLGLLG
jgi:hypothetical protein